MGVAVIKKVLLGICVLAGLTGCSETDEVSLGMTEQAIIHGEPALDEEYGAVVTISVNMGSEYRAYCTGVLIEEDVVLTAAHCVTDAIDLPFTQLLRDRRIAVIAAEDAAHPSADRFFTPKTIDVHFLYNAQRTVHDLALIRLNRAVPESVATPIEYAPYNDETKLEMYNHASVTFVGYGVDENNEDNRRLYYESSIYDYCPMIGNPDDCEKKDPTGAPLIMPVGTLMTDVEKGGPCLGDSGGPVLITIDNKKYVLGIVSFGDQGCQIYAVSSAIPDHSGWIEDTLHPKSEKSCSANVLAEPAFSPVVWMLMLGLMLGLRYKRRG